MSHKETHTVMCNAPSSEGCLGGVLNERKIKLFFRDMVAKNGGAEVTAIELDRAPSVVSDWGNVNKPKSHPPMWAVVRLMVCTGDQKILDLMILEMGRTDRAAILQRRLDVVQQATAGAFDQQDLSDVS